MQMESKSALATTCSAWTSTSTPEGTASLSSVICCLYGCAQVINWLMQFGPPRLRTSVCLSTHAVSEILASCLALSKQAVSACMAAEAPQPKYKLMFGSTATSSSYAIANEPNATSFYSYAVNFFLFTASRYPPGSGSCRSWRAWSNCSEFTCTPPRRSARSACTYLTVVSGAATAI